MQKFTRIHQACEQQLLKEKSKSVRTEKGVLRRITEIMIHLLKTTHTFLLVNFFCNGYSSVPVDIIWVAIFFPVLLLRK